MTIHVYVYVNLYVYVYMYVYMYVHVYVRVGGGDVGLARLGKEIYQGCISLIG